MTMKTISSPSRKTPLKLTTKANQSRPSLRSSPAARAAATSARYASSSSCSAFSPAERRIALRSHCSPKISNSVPTTSCSSASGSQDCSA